MAISGDQRRAGGVGKGEEVVVIRIGTVEKVRQQIVRRTLSRHLTTRPLRLSTIIPTQTKAKKRTRICT